MAGGRIMCYGRGKGVRGNGGMAGQLGVMVIWLYAST